MYFCIMYYYILLLYNILYTISGGEYRSRTDDLLRARQAL